MDREMIVKWFEFCRVEDKCSTDCPYWDYDGSARECTNKLAKDVLTLLKEQEAVRPKYIDGKRNHFIKCGKCNTDLMRGMKYCSYCGQEVKWDD